MPFEVRHSTVILAGAQRELRTRFPPDFPGVSGVTGATRSFPQPVVPRHHPEHARYRAQSGPRVRSEAGPAQHVLRLRRATVSRGALASDASRLRLPRNRREPRQRRSERSHAAARRRGIHVTCITVYPLGLPGILLVARDRRSVSPTAHYGQRALKRSRNPGWAVARAASRAALAHGVRHVPFPGFSAGIETTRMAPRPENVRPASPDERRPGCRCRLDVFDIHDVARIFGLQRTAAYALTRAPGFPRPYVVSSRCYRWPALEVLEYREHLASGDESS